MESLVEECEFHSKMIEKSPTMTLQENRPKIKSQLWLKEQDADQLKILEPNDPIMKRFQDALYAHLTRINKKLSDEINELEAEIKVANKTLEIQDKKISNNDLRISQQQKALENYQSMLIKVKSLYEANDQQVRNLKELHKKVSQELQAEKFKEKNLIQNLESLLSMEKSFIDWEKGINKDLAVSQRVSEKDAETRKKIIQQKQRKDYILFKLMNEVHKIEDEIRYLDEQLQLKEKEKIVVTQTIADANADLEALQRDQKKLLNTWNSVLVCISQRDNISNQLNFERRKIRDSFQNLQIQIQKIQKDTNKEMENNEQFTAIQLRLEDDMRNTLKVISVEKNKIDNLESQFAKITKLVEQIQKEYQNSILEYQQYENEEKILDKDFAKVRSQKSKLEEEILSNLDDKVTHDKVVRHLNKLLSEARNINQEHELLMIQTENVYGKNIYEIEELKSFLEKEKLDLQEIINKNIDDEKKIDQMQVETVHCDNLIEQRKSKIVILNKKIEEILLAAGVERNPLDLKIGALEKNIEETELKNKKLKQFWLRQEGNIVTLSQQRNTLTQELSLISKQITVIEQKNFKLQFDMQKQNKEKANIERTINLFQQKLTQINSRLVFQKGLKDELENKNYTTKSEYVKSLQDAEIDLIKLQTEIKYLINEKTTLKDQLFLTQRESLSWEKKVQLAVETIKYFKEERSSSGDIAIMKSEIHKMDIRLSHLKKIQEKLILDMESCIARRDIIMDGTIAKEKRNPKGLHNQRFLLRKRLDDQKTKIKQITKETKQIETTIMALEIEQKTALKKLNDGQRILRENEDAIPDIEKQIMEVELIKCHNLETLVRKQRKASMLQDMKNGRYKMLYKSEVALSEEIQNQRVLHSDLKDIMNQTNHDFPLLKKDIRKILLSLEAD